jgi:hypothetical protein
MYSTRGELLINFLPKKEGRSFGTGATRRQAIFHHLLLLSILLLLGASKKGTARIHRGKKKNLLCNVILYVDVAYRSACLVDER